MPKSKALGTFATVKYAQELAALEGQGRLDRVNQLQALCTEKELQRILNIETSHRRREAGIIAGHIVQSFGTTFSKEG